MSDPLTDRSTMRPRCYLLALTLLLGPALAAQPFTPLDIDEATPYGNVLWFDYDGDGDQDLLATSFFFPPDDIESRLYRNDGGTFTRVRGTALTERRFQTNAATAADYDNDGDPDLFLANANHAADVDLTTGSTLWRNDDGTFALVDDGPLGATNDLGIMNAAWGDYDGDGDLDLFGSVNSFLSQDPDDAQGLNRLFDNNGDGTFTANTTALPATIGPSTSAQAIWVDYDDDGGLDLTVTDAFFSDVPARTSLFFDNQRADTGTATFVQNTDLAFASVAYSPSSVQWVDYDNDGDLDFYVASAFLGAGDPLQAEGLPNALWRNDGGTFVQVTTGPIVADRKLSQAQVWADFDNDGDLDLYLTNGTSMRSSGGNDFYRNSGPPAYAFARESLGDATAPGRASNGAAVADYDQDGDLDLVVLYQGLTGGVGVDKLYRNDTESANWVRFRLEGAKTDDPASTGSNRSALGAVVRVTATIGGQAVQQRRDIVANDGFADQSDLAAHVGLADATTVTVVTVTWPSGLVQTFTDVDGGTEYRLREGETLVSVSAEDTGALPDAQRLEVYPNPARDTATFRYALAEAGPVRLTVYDVLGRAVATPVDGLRAAGEDEVQWSAADLPAGLYVARLDADGTTQTTAFTRLAR